MHDATAMPVFARLLSLLLALMLAALTTGCASQAPARPLDRHGTEIMVCGQLYDIGVPVVLFTDPGGYDAYRVERRFVPWEDSGWEKTAAAGVTEPARYNLRFNKTVKDTYSNDELEQIRGGGWTLPLLQQHVDQFVLHYDVCGTSRTCFRILHDFRGLSVHFMLDLDGTIYQTLDLKERAWHATISNDRSIGIEIANIGAYAPSNAASPLKDWYAKDEAGKTRITIPDRLGDGGIRTPDFIARPAIDEPIVGTINGSKLQMYDFTPEQYKSLIRLTAALCTIFPDIHPDFPRDANGNVRTDVLSPEEWKSFQGVLGHLHVQDNKADPGPAMQWEWYMQEVRKQLPASRSQN
jgi:N-acetylmuramoyl-L-alanine amidase